MHEKNIAVIEIELAPHPGKPTHVIRRTIDRNKGATGKRSRGIAASTYEINDKVVSLNSVKELVADTYHIQIANLCTFLPQDRVGSFSGFNAQDLLRETEKSVSGTQHLYDDHQRLIKLEEELLSSESNLETAKAELDRLEDEVQRLENAKKLMEERADSVKKLQLYQQKMLWVEFEDLRQVAVEAKAAKTETKKRLKKAQEGLEPLKHEIQVLEREYDSGKQRRVSLQKQIDTCAKKYNTCSLKAERCQDHIDTVQAELSSIESNQRRAEKVVSDRAQEVENIKSCLTEYPSKGEIDQKVKAAQDEVKSFKQKYLKARNNFSNVRS